MEYLNNLAKNLDKYYIKIPAFPKGLKDFIVQITPWLALIGGILTILSAINFQANLSVVSRYAAIAGVQGYATTGIFTTIIMLAQGAIGLLAFSPLKSNRIKGWNLLYYILILSIINSVVTISLTSILSSIIGALIGYYFLYQIKSYYK
jgi:hypothetical protein